MFLGWIGVILFGDLSDGKYTWLEITFLGTEIITPVHQIAIRRDPGLFIKTLTTRCLLETYKA